MHNLEPHEGAPSGASSPSDGERTQPSPITAPPPESRDQPSTEPSTRSLTVARSIQLTISTGRKILTDLIVMAAAMCLVAYVWRESGRDVVIIESFKVPASLEKIGYGADVIPALLVDRIDVVRTAANRRKYKDNISLSDNPPPDLQVPQAGLSLQSLVVLMRSFRNRTPVVVSGDIVSDSGALTLYVRVKGGITIDTVSAKRFRIPIGQGELGALQIGSASIRAALDSAAQHVIRQTQPLVLASYFIAIGDTVQAAREIEYCLSHAHGVLDARSYNERGALLEDGNRIDAALTEYQHAVGVDPTYWGAWHNWARVVLFDKGDYAAADGLVRHAMRADPTSELPVNLLGVVREAEGDYDGAIRAFRRATTMEMPEDYAYANWGDVLMREKQYRAAALKYEEAAGLSPTNAGWYLDWGDALRAAGDTDAARDRYLWAARVSPSTPTAYAQVGKAFYSIGRFVDGDAYLEHATALDTSSGALVYWGDVLRSRGFTVEAINRYQAALRRSPRQAPPLIGIGLANSTVDRPAAETAYSRAIMIDSTSATALYLLADLLDDEHRDDTAGQLVRRAIRLAPRDANTFVLQGWIRFHQQDVAGAEAAALRATKVDPTSAVAFLALGDFLAELHRAPEALRALARSIELDSDYVPPYIEAAKVYYKAGDVPGIAQLLAIAETREPLDTMAGQWRRQAVLLDMQVLANLNEQYRRRVERDPTDADAILRLALLLEKEDSVKSARQAYQRARAAALDQRTERRAEAGIRRTTKS